jgi:hypothetical protein
MRFIPIFWEIIRPLPPLVLTLVIGAASIAPEDAASNLSKWAHAIGFDRLPAWLVERSADKNVMIISGVALIFCLAHLLFLAKGSAVMLHRSICISICPRKKFTIL